MNCGQGKPYTLYSTNPRAGRPKESYATGGVVEEDTRIEPVRSYRNGGYIYTDKNDPDTVKDMDEDM